MTVDLSTRVGALRLENPVMSASGTYDPLSAGDALHPDRLGAIVPKSVTRLPQPGNPPARLAETPSGLINAIGIPSVGLERFVTEVLPRYQAFKAPLVMSVAGTTPEEFSALCAAMDRCERVQAVELNLSCPNLEDDRIPATDPVLLDECVRAARAATRLPLWAKLSPNVTDLVALARVAQTAGADALTLLNTFRAVAVDPHTARVVLGHLNGGLSGPAIRPLVLAAVWDVAHAVDLPVVGVGGIMTGEDAAAYLMAGACAVQVGTATFRDPMAMGHVIEGLARFMEHKGYRSVGELVGAARLASSPVTSSGA